MRSFQLYMRYRLNTIDRLKRQFKWWVSLLYQNEQFCYCIWCPSWYNLETTIQKPVRVSLVFQRHAHAYSYSNEKNVDKEIKTKWYRNSVKWLQVYSCLTSNERYVFGIVDNRTLSPSTYWTTNKCIRFEIIHLDRNQNFSSAVYTRRLWWPSKEFIWPW